MAPRFADARCHLGPGWFIQRTTRKITGNTRSATPVRPPPRARGRRVKTQADGELLGQVPAWLLWQGGGALVRTGLR